MKWSYTKSRIFDYCQRKWFYSVKMASSRAKDDMRKEAFYLKQLKSLYSWRGSLVDLVIEKCILPDLLKGNIPSQEEVLIFSEELINSQLEFGKSKKYREPGIVKSHVGDEYCAFYDIEYKGKIDQEELEKMKKEIKTALTNLLDSQLLDNICSNSKYIIAQRNLQYQLYEKINVTAVPDMIVFYEEEAPQIIDWKVHFFGTALAWRQLGIYALVLLNINPHKDFPENYSKNIDDISDMRLTEYQLLKNSKRDYKVLSEEVIYYEDYIFTSAKKILSVTQNRKYTQLDIKNFNTARSPRICENCEFKKLCWNEYSNGKKEAGCVE